MVVKLLTEHLLEFLSLNGGFTGSFGSTRVKIPHCWKSHALAQFSCVPMHADRKHDFTMPEKNGIQPTE